MAKEFRISRSTTIAAPPERILPLITTLKQWQKWSPWEGLDPNLERKYAGPDSGTGATYAWRGNSKAGQGRMEVVEVGADRVGIDLVFAAPMKAHNRVDFELTPADAAGTRVDWVMTGPQNLVMRLMSKFYSMEKMIGPDLEKGLRQLKQAAESA